VPHVDHDAGQRRDAVGCQQLQAQAERKAIAVSVMSLRSGLASRWYGPSSCLVSSRHETGLLVNILTRSDSIATVLVLTMISADGAVFAPDDRVVGVTVQQLAGIGPRVG
jgi:hypothetical protein